jgi:predicted transcriptional regulator
MRKVAVYLSGDDRARLARLANDRGTSRSEVIREALILVRVKNERANEGEASLAPTGGGGA